ncbi:MAG TPA: NADH-quinone oxidoreductase subunit NuoG [Acidimicrobiales bacterium]|jgi:NADH-quinone oxidoreductase subunit G|nr:NADH-quinone oxidoreductase subunit NuoG [Acidimicrobiales bacterium]
MADADGAPVSFTLDGRTVTGRPGEMVIAAAERAGTYIPRFCYHPRMAPVGVCRMCLVEIDSPRGATLQPACFVPVADGMGVVTTSDKVKKAQDGVLEFLLVNHPLDCPVCDKGGECPLQDQTLAHGPGDTRFLEEKRHFAKPIALSDLVLLDRERCIQCSRCTRFAAEVAGEAEIDFAGRGELVEVAVFPTEPFTSHFSGNTVQICPVGALTATPYRFTARPWDLDQVESTCTTCSVGCRVAVQSSADRITRLLGVDSEPINHGWLCDKGRFAYEATNGQEPDEPSLPLTSPRRRVTVPLVRRDGELVEVSWGVAIGAAADAIRRASASTPDGVGAIGGAALTNEAQYQWARLLKGVVRTDNVDAQLGDGLDPVLVAGLPRATIEDAASARTVLLMAGDLHDELPVLFLRLRQAAMAKSTVLVELAATSTRLSRSCHASLRVRPGDAPDVVDALLGDEEAARRLATNPEGASFDAVQLDRAREALSPDGEGVVVVVGRPNVAESGLVVEAAIRRLARALPRARFLVGLRRANVAGAIDLGLVPGLLPGRVRRDAARAWFEQRWGGAPTNDGRDAIAQLRALADGSQTCVVLLGCDPLADAVDPALAEAALVRASDVVVVTGHGGPALSHASVVLPASVAHERDGSTTNLEGRVLRLGQKLAAPGQAWPDTDIAAELIAALGGGDVETDVALLTDEIADACATHAGITTGVLRGADDGSVIGRGAAAPRGALDPMAFPGVQSPGLDGLRSPAGAVGLPVDPTATSGAPSALGTSDVLGVAESFATPPHDAYSLRLVAVRRLYDRGAAVEASPSLHALVETASLRANPYDLDRIGAPDGVDVRIRSSRTVAVLRAVADPSVIKGTVCIGLNLDAPGVADRVAARFIDPDQLVTEVRMESL